MIDAADQFSTGAITAVQTARNAAGAMRGVTSATDFSFQSVSTSADTGPTENARADRTIIDLDSM